jgi:ribosomal protein L7/L12
MKFTLTHKEAVKLIKVSFDLSDDIEVVIGRPNSKAEKKATKLEQDRIQTAVDDEKQKAYDKAVNIVDTIFRFDYKGQQKIAAIKELRNLVPGMGLSQAKWVVENFGKICDFIEDNRRFPVVNDMFGSYDYRLT